MRTVFTLVAISGMVVLPAFAQEDAKPAPVLQIIREGIKEGRGPAHEKVEADWAAAMRKSNHPSHYVGLTAMSGTSEVWFIEPMPSFAVSEDYDKISEKE